MNSYVYWSRCLIRNIPQTTDYRHFPNAIIRKGTTVRHFEDARSGWEDRIISTSRQSRPQEMRLSALLAQTGSTACIVMQRQKILHESYFNGYTANNINTSFSVAKSMTAVLMGVALDEGAIGSIQDAVARYIPAFDTPALPQTLPGAWTAGLLVSPKWKAASMPALWTFCVSGPCAWTMAL